MPWRKTRDPYAIWVSEIMLQQTQVATVIPYWERWMAQFPTVQHLANAEEAQVLTLWAGLGYYRRARMLHEGAKVVVETGLPQDAAGWRAVPGVGKYTAGAIASIALGQPSALVDGNVERVFARLTANDFSGPALNRAAWEWAETNLDQRNPGDWNQALMELGATVCTPRNPRCGGCPVRELCEAHRRDLQAELPRMPERRKTVELSMPVGLFELNGRYAVRQIPPGEWWEGMWEFVRLSVGPQAPPALQFTQAVTHHRLRFRIFELEGEPDEPCVWYSVEELQKLPLPAPQKKILKWVMSGRNLQNRLVF